jgi:hypothetical protein
MPGRVFRPHTVDREQLKLLLALPAHKRIRVMLDARELAVGMMRGRMRKKYPHLTINMLNMKVLEELARAR